MILDICNKNKTKKHRIVMEKMCQLFSVF